MRIGVFGLGYVGVVAAGCLAEDGHQVIGVDTNVSKVDLINRGESPIIERDIGKIIARAVANGSLRAVGEAGEAIASCDISLICVGTPSQMNGSLDLSYVRRVCEEIGDGLRAKDEWHLIVVRSTILPATMRSLIIPVLEERSGKRAGQGFGICNNPEFLREGSAVYDYNNPPKTVIGEIDNRSGETLAALYSKLSAPLIRTSIEVAEAVKYVDNTWHALKVAFANEIGSFCKEMNIDSHKVMDIFCQDTKLNLSSYYMRPGFAFGGSCLPKDVRALTHKASKLDLDLPLLSAILPSNRSHIDRGYQMIVNGPGRRIAVLGFSFKAGTDDLRESPLVELIERLIGKGYDLRLYDRNVSLAALKGANRDYILNHIPHISRLLNSDIDAALAGAEIIVIGNASPEFGGLQFSPSQRVIDFVRIEKSIASAGYEGICW